MPDDPLRDLRVVLCSDDPIDAEQIERIIELGGMKTVGAARDGRMAINVVLGKRPDIVVMDKTIPIYDGLLAARAILEQFSTCVVLLLRRSDEHLRAEALEAGVTSCVVKPIDSVRFLYELEDSYGKFRERQSAPIAG